jgi:integrase
MSKEKNRKKKRGNAEGSIYRMKDGRWRAAVSLGRDVKGKPIRKTFTKPTRHEVQAELTKALRDQQLGLPVRTEKETTGQFLQHWLNEVVKNRVRPRTFQTYCYQVKYHMVPGLGEIQLGKLSPQHVREFLNAKIAAKLSPQTVKHLLVVLRGALAVAVKDGQIPRNVASLVDPPRVPRRQMRAFTPAEARAFLDIAAGHRLEAVYTVAVAVGMRQGEILGLKWSDIDLETGILKVRAALQRIDKKLTEVEPKSTTSHRPIHLPATCLTALIRHKAKQEEERQWAGSKWRDTGYVFTTRVGTPMDARDLLRDYYRITRPKAKPGEGPIILPFPAIRFHDLRHSTATILLAQGVSPKYISELLGHSQVSFTMQVYAHAIPEVQKSVADKMDAVLSGAAEKEKAESNLVATRVATNESSASIN